MQYRFMRFPEGKSKALTLSYDDGSKNDVKLAEIINKYGVKCTFNLTNSVIDAKEDGYYITSDQIEELILAYGHETAVHTASHVAPGQSTSTMGIKQVLDNRLALEAKFGRIIKGMAYPNSGITRMNENVTIDRICTYLKELGISYARTLGGDNNSFSLPDNWYRWMPTCHHNNPKLMEWLEEFKNIDTENVYYSSKFPRLFYLWGHSHEFANHGNWEVLEEFCKSATESDQIWFATNIEIYNYTNAYFSLQFSADETIVYNPTLYKIWFVCDDKNYCIEPGETLKLA